MSLDWLPDAKRDTHGSHPLSWASTKHPKGCLHTTEGGSWPTYSGWKINPHATVLPTKGKGVEVRQHLPFSQASFSLVNAPGGVETNRDYVFQFELIGTAQKGGPGYYWPDADDAVLLDLYRKVIAPLDAAFVIPFKSVAYQAYPGSFGARGKTNTVRMPGSVWETYTGWLGHEHVPENDHGDPGAFPWARLVQVAQATTGDDDVQDIKLETQYQVDAANALDKPGGSPSYKIGDVIPADKVNMYGDLREQQILAEIRALAAQVVTLSATVSKLSA